MIAGRRKADEAPAEDREGREGREGKAEKAEKADKADTPAEKPRAASRRTKADDDERPARSTSRAAAAEDDDEDADDGKPRVRRSRRGGAGRTRRTSEASEPADDATEDQAEARDAAPAAAAPAETVETEDEPAEVRPRRAATRRTASAAAPAEAPTALLDEIQSLRATMSKQERMLEVLASGIDNLGERITFSGYRPRIAIFVDVPNLIYGYEGDGTLNMGKILDMLTEGRDLVRATAYSPVSDDPREPMEQQRFVAPFVPYEYRIVTKPLKRFADGSIKGNFDVEMAIDMVLMADRVDVMACVSGDADFARAVEAVQQKGVRVEVIAFAGSTSLEMRALADHYLELGRVVDKIL
ncbi:MAG: NYN domain-containing protein [Dehalococcoidia bacterium]|nr:NYN domain-containing protein [Dehalococcoidia bacterium]